MQARLSRDVDPSVKTESRISESAKERQNTWKARAK